MSGHAREHARLETASSAPRRGNLKVMRAARAGLFEQLPGYMQVVGLMPHRRGFFHISCKKGGA